MNKTYKLIDETLKEPMVSVAMLTYGHENFIREAIDSVLMQKTNFRIQLVIAEDCSPDNTKEIILDYQKRYPKIIKLVLQNTNVGASRNNVALFENLEGKYVAALEGDDYWTDPLKLQKQVDFLEQNEDYVLHYYNANVIDNSGEEISSFICEKEIVDYQLSDFFNSGNKVITLTTCFRNIPELKDQFTLQKLGEYPFGDIALWIFLCFHTSKNVRCDGETVGGSYRKHIGGIYNSQLAHINTEKLFVIQGLNLKNYPNYSEEIKKFDNKIKFRYLIDLFSFNKWKGLKYFILNYKSARLYFSTRDLVYCIRKY